MSRYLSKGWQIRRPRRWALACAAVAGVSVPAHGGNPSLSMLDSLDTGRWELRPLGEVGAVERICLQDPRTLIQLRHRLPNCQRLIIDDKPMEVTVQYICRGRGYGRTHIRRETGRLVQIETQGIADGLPFDYSFEARKTGECTT